LRGPGIGKLLWQALPGMVGVEMIDGVMVQGESRQFGEQLAPADIFYLCFPAIDLGKKVSRDHDGDAGGCIRFSASHVSPIYK